MIPHVVGKLAPNSSHFIRGLVNYVPVRGYFRAVSNPNPRKYRSGGGWKLLMPLKSVDSFEYKLSKERRNNSLLLFIVALFALCS